MRRWGDLRRRMAELEREGRKKDGAATFLLFMDLLRAGDEVGNDLKESLKLYAEAQEPSGAGEIELLVWRSSRQLWGFVDEMAGSQAAGPLDYAPLLPSGSVTVSLKLAWTVTELMLERNLSPFYYPKYQYHQYQVAACYRFC
ncbi:MAG: hypothetical protein APR56_00095 [Methanosaeta sp. SDB]|nr:MAG: hypothetical protein APR56_00095 [Methanosaeta sp. SDB]